MFISKLKLTALLVAAILFSAHASAGNPMSSSANVIAILEDQGPRLFEGNLTVFANLELAIAGTQFQGLAVVAPGVIQVNALQELPVVLVSRQTVLRGWEVSEQNNLLLALSDLNTGKVQFSRVLADAKDDEQGDSMQLSRSPRPGESAGAAIETQLRKIDLLNKFNLDKKPSSLAVTALSYDWVANSARVELSGTQLPVLETTKPSLPAETTAGLATALPSFMANSASAQPPANSLIFGVDEAATNRERLVLFGSFAKMVSHNELLNPPQAVKDHDSNQIAVASVPLSFVVLGLDWKMPRVKDFGIPVYQVNTQPSGEMRGHFRLDALAEKTTPLEPGHYVVYAFMEGKAYGPIKFAIP